MQRVPRAQLELSRAASGRPLRTSGCLEHEGYRHGRRAVSARLDIAPSETNCGGLRKYHAGLCRSPERGRAHAINRLFEVVREPDSGSSGGNHGGVEEQMTSAVENASTAILQTSGTYAEEN